VSLVVLGVLSLLEAKDLEPFGGSILVLAGLLAGSALVVEVLYAPPYWVHALLWGPLILLTTLAPLRPIKGLLIALQYHHKAAEGRLSGGNPP